MPQGGGGGHSSKSWIRMLIREDSSTTQKIICLKFQTPKNDIADFSDPKSNKSFLLFTKGAEFHFDNTKEITEIFSDPLKNDIDFHRSKKITPTSGNPKK